MSTKPSYRDPLEFDETGEADRTVSLIDSMLGKKRKRAGVPGPEIGKPAAAILPLYLREMGSTPLIDEHQEVALARELQEARQGMSRVAIKLPAA